VRVEVRVDQRIPVYVPRTLSMWTFLILLFAPMFIVLSVSIVYKRFRDARERRLRREMILARRRELITSPIPLVSAVVPEYDQHEEFIDWAKKTGGEDVTTAPLFLVQFPASVRISITLHTACTYLHHGFPHEHTASHTRAGAD
jgi:hypothetical protein